MRRPMIRSLDAEASADVPTLLDSAALAARIGLSRRAIERLRMVGGGPPFLKLGHRVLYDPQLVSLWLRGRVFTSTTHASRVRGEL